MFDNPQQKVNNTSKKLRPIKLSDEAFELFYKEIYAEFGPKDVPPVELNPKKEVAEEVCEEVLEEAPAEVEVQVPAEVCEEAPQELTPVQEENEEAEAESEEVREEDEEVQEEPDDQDEDEDDDDEDDTVQEEAAKAAAVIMNVQEDEVIDEDTEGVTLVKPKKQKGIKGLVITICLELLAIAGIVAYWLLYIL